MLRLMTLALLVIAACGNVTRNSDEVAHDAAIRESRELVNGSARMSGATYTFDLQVGHGMQQKKTMGSTYRFEGNAAVKP